MGANRELAERIIAALNRGDVEAAASMYAPDATYVDPSGTTHGPAVIADLYRGLREAFPDANRRIERAVEKGNWAAFEMTMTATHTGPLRLGGGSVPASGSRLDMRLMHIAQVRDGQCMYTHEATSTSSR